MTKEVTPPRLARRVGSLLLCAYLAGAAVLFFWPSGSRIHRMNLDFWWQTRRLFGAPPGYGPDQAEILANAIVMFLPVLALCLIFVRVKPWVWVLLAALASAGIEVTQGFVLPHRKLDLTDFLANTAGAMLGGFVGVIILRFMGSRVPSDPEDRSAVD